MKHKRRRLQAWFLMAYSLSILGANFTDRGRWRHVGLGVAVGLLTAVVCMLVRNKSRNGCPGSVAEGHEPEQA